MGIDGVAGAPKGMGRESLFLGGVECDVGVADKQLWKILEQRHELMSLMCSLSRIPISPGYCGGFGGCPHCFEDSITN